MAIKLYAIVMTVMFISMTCVGIHIDIIAIPFAILGGLILGIAIGAGCDLDIEIICKKCKKKK